jgi:hypothetical protein
LVFGIPRLGDEKKRRTVGAPLITSSRMTG